MSDNEIKFTLEEHEKALNWTGDKARAFADCATEFQIELAARGITNKAQRELLTKALASRHALADYLSGNTKVFDAREAVNQTLSSIFGDFAGTAAKPKEESEGLSQEQIDKMTPAQRINYSRGLHKVGR